MNQYVGKKTLRSFGKVNWLGLWTLTSREVRRFLKVWQQTIFGPIVTSLLFLFVFSVAIGKTRPEICGLPFVNFLAPGLIMMVVLQNSFANTSSSIVSAKVQGVIIDILMPPLNSIEVTTGYALGGIARGIILAIIGFFIIAQFTNFTIHNIFTTFFFVVMGSLMMALIGIAGGLWAEKFDHMGTITNFIITPMTFLSGTFYSIKDLPDAVYQYAKFNPFFHAIDGFRYGITGYADSNVFFGGLFLFILNIILYGICYSMISRGYKVKS